MSGFPHEEPKMPSGASRPIDFGELNYNDLGLAYAGMANRFTDLTEALHVIETFAQDAPGLYQFIMAVNETERRGLEEDGDTELLERLDESGQLTVVAKSMLLGFLVVQSANDVAVMRSELEAGRDSPDSAHGTQ